MDSFKSVTLVNILYFCYVCWCGLVAVKGIKSGTQELVYQSDKPNTEATKQAPKINRELVFHLYLVIWLVT